MRFAVTVALCALIGAPLKAQSILRGVLVDSATKRGLSGVIVDLASADKHFAVRSDEVGEFQILDVPPDSYRAVFRRIGYAPLTRTIVVTEKMRPIEISLAPLAQSLREVRVRGQGAGIYGQVGTSEGLTPIAGARVQVAGTNETATDSVGTFFIPVKRAATYVVRINAPGFAEDFFPIEVKRDQVADGSRLLDPASKSRVTPPGLWEDFDQRLRWRSVNSALTTGSEIRHGGANLVNGLQASSSFVSKGFRFGSTVCVFLNGSPAPAYPLNAIRPEEVKAVEVYGNDREVVAYLGKSWIGQCTQTGMMAHGNSANGEIVKYLVIWTR